MVSPNLRTRSVAVVAAALVVSFLFAGTASASAEDELLWPRWRGPLGTGEAPDAQPPLVWSESDNIAFKVPIPGLGTSTPLVRGNLLFLTTAMAVEGGVENEREWLLLALDRMSGEEVWRQTVRRGVPHEGTHPDGTWASNSPVMDDERIYAFFGSQGLYAYDFEGNQIWKRDLGDMTTRLSFGEGASPALWGNRIAILWDHEGDSFIYVLDATNGETVWEETRDEATSWTTPIIVEHDGRAQVITCATNRIRSYDLETGEVIWEASGMTLNTIPTPIHRDGIVYFMSGFRGSSLMAIGLDGAKGDVTGTENVLFTPRPRHTVRSECAALRFDALLPQEQQPGLDRLRHRERQATLGGRNASRASTTSTPHRSGQPDGCTSPDARAPRW